MNDRFGTEVSKTSLNGSWKVSFYICSFEGTRKNGWIIPIVFLIYMTQLFLTSKKRAVFNLTTPNINSILLYPSLLSFPAACLLLFPLRQ